MALQNFNELNNIQSIPREIYFGEMDLNTDQKDNRIELARQLEDDFMFLFALLAFAYSEEYLANTLAQRYRNTVSNFMDVDDELGKYIDDISKEIVHTTVKHKDDEKYKSYDRAVNLGEEESNTIFNRKDYKDAVDSGFTMKQWVDIRDNRERKTHLEVGGTQIPIAEAFNVGKYKMLYPKDSSLGAGAEEIANCRCTIKYF